MDIQKKCGPQPRAGKASTKDVRIRVTEEEKLEWNREADASGFKNLSMWIRHLVDQAEQHA